MGFTNMVDSPGYHHAIVISPATYARHLFPDDIGQNELFWKSEDAAWHLASQLMSRYSTLAVLGFRASFSIPSNVWNDATRLNACFFSQASRIIILVPSDAEAHIEAFTRACLRPILTSPEERGGHPEWKERFIVAVIGNVRVPTELAPGIPFVKVIRFREIGWVRDITAMMLLHRAIQNYWVPSNVSFAPTRPYWNWAGGSAQSSCQMSETIVTKSSLGTYTHVTGQMEPVDLEPGRSKSVDSRRSSSRRRRQSKPPKASSRSRSRSQHSNSSGYRSLDPEFEAQQTEELLVDTRVINVLDGSQPIYLMDVAPRRETLEDAHKLVVTQTEDIQEHEILGAEQSSPTLGKSLKEQDKILPDESVLHTEPLKVETEYLSKGEKYKRSAKSDSGFVGNMIAKEPIIKDDVTTSEEVSACERSIEEFSRSDPSEAATVIEAESVKFPSQTSIFASATEVETPHPNAVSTGSLSMKEQSTEDKDSRPEKSMGLEKSIEDQSTQTKIRLHVCSTAVNELFRHNELTVTKLAFGSPPNTVSESVSYFEPPPTIVTRSIGNLEAKKPKSPPPTLPSKTRAKFIFSQMFFRKESDQENNTNFHLPYIDSEGLFEKRNMILDIKGSQVETALPDSEQAHQEESSSDIFDHTASVQNSTGQYDKSSPVHQHYWKVITTRNSSVATETPIVDVISQIKKKQDAPNRDQAATAKIRKEPLLITRTSMKPITKEDTVTACQQGKEMTPEPLSVVHHIPVTLFPTLKEMPIRKIPIHDAFVKPSSPKPVRASSAQTRYAPVHIEREVADTTIDGTDSPLMKKKHVSYSMETITLSESTETSTRSLPLRTNFGNFQGPEHQTDSARQSTLPLPLRTRSVTPVRIESSLASPKGQSTLKDQELTSSQSLRSFTTPSGRVLYFRSATPSRLSSTDLGMTKFPRSQSVGQVRLAEPSILTGNLVDIPIKSPRPRVHIYPSPWRPLNDETVADASTQMSGPLASGYMQFEGVRCYAFTGTHYCKRTTQSPRVVLYKDTAIWTGPDAGETYRLEVLFATRPGLMVSRERVDSSKETKKSDPETPSVACDKPLVVSSPTVLSAVPSRAEVEDQISSNESTQSTEAQHCWTILLYIFSCFVALVALAVAFFCLTNGSDESSDSKAAFVSWLNSFGLLVRHQ